MHGLDWEEDVCKMEDSGFQALWQVGVAHRMWELD